MQLLTHQHPTNGTFSMPFPQPRHADGGHEKECDESHSCSPNKSSAQTSRIRSYDLVPIMRVQADDCFYTSSDLADNL